LRPFLAKPGLDWMPRPPEQSTAAAGDTLEAFVTKVAVGYTVEQPVLNAGEFYPRIWRTGSAIEKYGEPLPLVEETRYFRHFVQSLQQIEALFESLAGIFRVVYPAMDNLAAYGGAIRDLLILACTEVEAQCKGVLVANKVKEQGSQYKTTDYVKLQSVMKLNSYEIALIRYPALKATAPFAFWNATRPTQSLPWYETYNKVKHDREANFKEASLGHAIEAVAACVVMLVAQYGVHALHRHRLNNLFEFRDYPRWEPREWYYQPVPQERWVEVECPM
jgi:hypothetical protein